MYTDQEIVEKLRQRVEENAIITYLYRTCGRDILNLGRYKGLLSDDANDLLQEVMEVFIKNVADRKYEPRIDVSIRTYLLGIADKRTKAHHRGWFRRLTRQATYLLGGDKRSISPEDLLMNRDWEPALAKLEKEERLIIQSYYFDGLNYEEIAAMHNELGTAGAVKTRKCRIMKKLKKLMDE
jgi:RNA polymerase sigma factor (sigma-70 family)